jgi:hypothetical protein
MDVRRPALQCAVFSSANRKRKHGGMTLRAAKWTATLTRATQTPRERLDGPPTYAFRGMWASKRSRARARASRSCAQDGWVPKPSTPGSK